MAARCKNNKDTLAGWQNKEDLQMRRDGAEAHPQCAGMVPGGQTSGQILLKPEAHKKFLRTVEPPKDFENFSMGDLEGLDCPAAIFAPAPLESVLVLLEYPWECSWKSRFCSLKAHKHSEDFSIVIDILQKVASIRLLFFISSDSSDAQWSLGDDECSVDLPKPY